MSEQTVKLLDNLREHLAGIMLQALKNEGIYLDEDAYFKLKGALMETLDGKLKV